MDRPGGAHGHDRDLRPHRRRRPPRRGDDLDDLFRTAAEGLFDYIVANRGRRPPRGGREVLAPRRFARDLLANWLSELIFRSETHHRLFREFDVHVEDDGLRLDASVHGETIDRDRHVLDHEVKAVTRHGLRLERDGAGWLAEMILDI